MHLHFLAELELNGGIGHHLDRLRGGGGFDGIGEIGVEGVADSRGGDERAVVDERAARHDCAGGEGGGHARIDRPDAGDVEARHCRRRLRDGERIDRGRFALAHHPGFAHVAARGIGDKPVAGRDGDTIDAADLIGGEVGAALAVERAGDSNYGGCPFATVFELSGVAA